MNKFLLLSLLCSVLLFGCKKTKIRNNILGHYEVLRIERGIEKNDTTVVTVSVKKHGLKKFQFEGTNYDRYKFEMDETGRFNHGSAEDRPVIEGRLWNDSLIVYGAGGPGLQIPMAYYIGSKI